MKPEAGAPCKAVRLRGDRHAELICGRRKTATGNAATAEEAVYATNEAYVQCVGTACNHPTLPGFYMSERVQIIMLRFSIFGGTQNFLGLSWSTSGTGRFFVWRSDEGGML